MTNSKAYNLRLYCKLLNIDQDSEDAKNFLVKSILEQLNIIKKIRENSTEISPDTEEEEESDYSILSRIIRK
tara:strand:+ start:846 stop:1061 length:216 start_codon:yes stop_codon:yes gene_type:complete